MHKGTKFHETIISRDRDWLVTILQREMRRHATSNTRGVAISVCKLLPTATALSAVARSKVITVFPPNIATRS